MNTFDIIAILAILALAFLYWTTRQKLKNATEAPSYKVDPSYSLDLLEEISLLKEENKKERQDSESLSLKLAEQRHEYLKSKAQLEDLLSKANEEALILRPVNQDVNGILASINDFAQSAEISSREIRMNVKDLISEEYISVIRGLHKIGLFPLNLQQDFNFDPKSLAVKIQLIIYNEEGGSISFKSWSDFLYERDRFIKVISSYVESVINQRRINQAVDLALNGTEVESV